VNQIGPRGRPQSRSQRTRNPPAVVERNQDGDGYSTDSAYDPRPRPRRSPYFRNLQKLSPRPFPR